MTVPSCSIISGCPVCDETSLEHAVCTPRVRVFRCKGCGHRIAVHNNSLPTADYHWQYEQTSFLSSLSQTRRRQSTLLVSLIKKYQPHTDGIVDFGAGRGWFLEACREAGMRHLAGIDTSRAALSLISEKGFEALEVSPPACSQWDPQLARLHFKPRVLVLLDVLEHVPPEYAVTLLHGLIKGAGPQLELVAVKVPVSSGMLYRTAEALTRVGVSGPLDQLYQAGTFPPHYSYFSDRSLSRLLERCGLIPLEKKGDRDFEAASFGDRVQSFRSMPRFFLKLAGAGVALGCYFTGWYDALMVIAKGKDI